MKSTRTGFSLIELMVVLTIVSIVVGAVAMKWSAAFEGVNFESTVDRIVNFDYQTRRHAMSAGKPCTIRFDLEENEMVATRWSNGEEYLTRFHTAEPIEFGLGGTNVSKNSGNPFEVEVSKQGASSTYFLEISHGQKSRWIMIAGGSGQVNEYENKTAISKVFASLTVAGIDAR